MSLLVLSPNVFLFVFLSVALFDCLEWFAFWGGGSVVFLAFAFITCFGCSFCFIWWRFSCRLLFDLVLLSLSL